MTNRLLLEASGIHRVERWGNMHLQERGLTLDPRMIGVIDTAANVPGLGVIPNLARLLMSPVWGWLFDRVNFFTLRMAVNLGFAIGIFSFFASHSMLGPPFGFSTVNLISLPVTFPL